MTQTNIPARFWHDVPRYDQKTRQSLELHLQDEKDADLWTITKHGFHGLRQCSHLRNVQICSQLQGDWRFLSFIATNNVLLLVGLVVLALVGRDSR